MTDRFIEKGRMPASKGVKRGHEDGVSPHNSRIENDVYSKDWNTPLNAANPGMPGPSPRQGGVLQVDSDLLGAGAVPNPLGIPNIEPNLGRPGTDRAKVRGSKGSPARNPHRG